jgi:serine/threonine protein phosphatase PrpC
VQKATDTTEGTFPPDAPPLTTTSALRLTTFGLTDRGQVRKANEDQFLVAEVRRVLQVQHSSIAQPDSLLGDTLGHLMVVADGIGGHRGGDVASAMAVVGIENLLLNTINWLCQLHGEGVLRELHQALRTTDRWVEQAAGRRPELNGMGTTVTMAYVSESTLFVAHAGDSRCYLWRGGDLTRLTRDHTLVAELVSAGTLTPEQASHHEMRNVVLNSVGGGSAEVRPEVHKHVLEPRDVVLLCTDGLTGMISDDELSAAVARMSSPEQACRALVDEANRRGGQDNITVVVGRLDEPAPPPEPASPV